VAELEQEVKSLRIACLQHVPFEGPGHIADWAHARGHALSDVRVYAGDPLPDQDAFDMLVIMGGPMSVNDKQVHPWLQAEEAHVRVSIDGGKTVIGICLGAQLIASALGARVYRAEHKEIGWWPVQRSDDVPGTHAFGEIPAGIHAFHWHGETFELPEGAVLLASSEACTNQAFAVGDRIVGLQFHFEITHDGVEDLLDNCRDDVTPGRYVQAMHAILDNTQFYNRANTTMCALLDGLAEDTDGTGE